jgi:uncharacterized protein YjbI with pentapeptide repeats
MADEAQLKILKTEGVGTWNRWRKQNPKVKVNLCMANLSGADLSRADLERTLLSGAYLGWANLRGADLEWAVLSGAILHRADLSMANLFGANLSMADLDSANLNRANLSGTDVSGSKMGWTSLGGVDLSEVRGLETVEHSGPSTIGIDSIYWSVGKIPEVFLRGAGVPDDFITYMKSLVTNPIEYCSCFISYSSKDEEFAQRLYADLQNKGVHCWFAPEDLKIGDRFRERIDEAVRIYDKLLLVLSETSIESPWVEDEVEAAFEKERQQKRLVLFPIRLDDAVMTTTRAWAGRVRRILHMGDFREWRSHDSYQKVFSRLLRDLKGDDKPKGEKAE